MARPRALRVVSATSGLPPASEKRATTGTALPENNGERLYFAVSGAPTKSPAAQVPLAWFLRKPGWLPKVPTSESTTWFGATCCACAAMAKLDATSRVKVFFMMFSISLQAGWNSGTSV